MKNRPSRFAPTRIASARKFSPRLIASSEQIRGEGDATAAKTYADSYNQDQEFYSFYRSLKAYDASFGNNQDIILLSPDSDFFKFFKDSESSR